MMPQFYNTSLPWPLENGSAEHLIQQSRTTAQITIRLPWDHPNCNLIQRLSRIGGIYPLNLILGGKYLDSPVRIAHGAFC